MPSCEVQRTLVKSPPELWAELSDPASLAKHLGEFGEIRTVRIEPETAVEWEAEDVRGVVQLKASGWGTKVTLTAVREIVEEETPAGELEPSELAPAPPPGAELEAEADERALPEPVAEPAPELSTVAEAMPVDEPEPEPTAESEPESFAEPEPERRRGLFARLFRRRHKAQPTPELEVLDTDEHAPFVAEELAAGEEPTLIDALAPIVVGELVPAEELVAAAEPAAAEEPALIETPEPEPTPADRPDLAVELAQVEQAMVEQDAALLTAVLDRLGAAHHRPFSRG